VINPTDCAGSVLQFAACPGPNERANMHGTSTYFGERGGSFVGREYVTTCAVKRGMQLAHWYGEGWWAARHIKRADMATGRYPMPRRAVGGAEAAASMAAGRDAAKWKQDRECWSALQPLLCGAESDGEEGEEGDEDDEDDEDEEEDDDDDDEEEEAMAMAELDAGITTRGTEPEDQQSEDNDEDNDEHGDEDNHHDADTEGGSGGGGLRVLEFGCSSAGGVVRAMREAAAGGGGVDTDGGAGSDSGRGGAGGGRLHGVCFTALAASSATAAAGTATPAAGQRPALTPAACSHSHLSYSSWPPRGGGDGGGEGLFLRGFRADAVVLRGVAVGGACSARHRAVAGLALAALEGGSGSGSGEGSGEGSGSGSIYALHEEAGSGYGYATAEETVQACAEWALSFLHALRAPPRRRGRAGSAATGGVQEAEAGAGAEAEAATKGAGGSKGKGRGRAKRPAGAHGGSGGRPAWEVDVHVVDPQTQTPSAVRSLIVFSRVPRPAQAAAGGGNGGEEEGEEEDDEDEEPVLRQHVY
jgi:hypothetical protein